MGQQPTRVLLIEDDESDYLLVRRMLSSIPNRVFDLEWAPSYSAGLEAIRRAEHDVCLLDYRVDGSDGLELLKKAHEAGSNAPVIVLTGISDHQLDVEAMRLGAADFLVKDQVTATQLERSMRYAIAQALMLEELRRQQEELRASELRFRSVVQSASDAIILADESARIIGWNQGAETIFGYNEEEVLGFPLEVLMPERYREAHRMGVRRFRMGAKPHVVGKTVQLEGLRKDGSDFPIELSLASWTSGEGTFFTGIIRDITERKRVEEMGRAKEAAEEASRAKSTFVTRMSHELRTPLHAIIGFTHLLLQKKNSAASDTDFLKRILLNAQDQLRLINSILDLSKVEAGKLDVEAHPVAVDEMVRDVVKQLEGQRRNAGVEITLRVPPSTRPITTDGGKLKQVLINLIDNALKFTESGSVTVSVVTSPMDSSPVRIDVTDTGPGIPAYQLHEIFEPFQQVETQAIRRGGTGLGLTISRSLCELLGYDLQVQSQEGRGSTFSILLAAETVLPLSA
jgi:protein-histidine pros-kinase